MATAQLETLLWHIRKLATGGCAPQQTDRQLLDDFAARRDQAAFAALVARHGSMVLRVCRRVLNHEQDAEDAFQATFLILARHTGSIRKREAVASWLYGVAYRTAMKAKRGAARRRNHEARVRTVTPQPARSPTWDEVQAVLDEEVQGLPQHYRQAFVLCVLEGKSGPETAVELGCKEGTVKSRVNRARQQLQRKLTRRGINLATLLAAVSVADSVAQASMSAPLAQATIRLGLLVAAGEPAAGVIPPHIAALAAGVTRAMFLTRTKIATNALLVVGIVAAGAAALAQQVTAADETAKPPVATSAQPPAAQVNPPAAADNKDSIVYSGRVVGRGGRPIAGAKLYLTHWRNYFSRVSPAPVSAATRPDGRFQFAAPKAQFGD